MLATICTLKHNCFSVHQSVHSRLLPYSWRPHTLQHTYPLSPVHIVCVGLQLWQSLHSHTIAPASLDQPALQRSPNPEIGSSPHNIHLPLDA